MQFRNKFNARFSPQLTFMSLILVFLSMEVSDVNSNEGMAWLGYWGGNVITRDTTLGPLVAHTVQLLWPASIWKQSTILTGENTHKSLNLLQCKHFQRGTGEYTAYPQTLFLSLKNSLLDYSASSSKVYVSPPSIAVLTPPFSPQRWAYLAFSPSSPARKASGQFSHI